MKIGTVITLLLASLPALAQVSVEEAKAKLEERQRQRTATLRDAATQPSAIAEVDRLRAENSALKEEVKALKRQLAKNERASSADVAPRPTTPNDRGIGFAFDGVYDEDGKIGMRFTLTNSGAKDVSAVRLKMSVTNDKGKLLFATRPLLFDSPL
jgi:cell division protein FtsB